MSGFKFFILWLGLTVSVTVSFATSFYPQPFDQTVQEAPLIIRGKTGDHSADWSKDSEGVNRIYTFYELKITEVIKTPKKLQLNANGTLLMREMGGEKDGIGLHIPGVSQFQKNEDVVVFLNPTSDSGVFDVHGMAMGKYSIETDAQGRETLSGMGVSSALPSPEHLHAGELPAAQKKWTLEDLRNLVHHQEEKNPSADPTADTHPNSIHGEVSAPKSNSTPPQNASVLSESNEPSAPLENSGVSWFFVALGLTFTLGLMTLFIFWMKKNS
ncbi:MAG: hypothetical protein ACO3A2_11140 [Bdellovibrionia bacterium]